MEPGLSTRRAPLRVYFESSVLIANMVRVMSLESISAGILTTLDLDSGSNGKSSWGRPAIRKRLDPQVTVTQLASPRLNLISLSGSARMISYSLFAGSVMIPAVVVFAAQ